MSKDIYLLPCPSPPPSIYIYKYIYIYITNIMPHSDPIFLKFNILKIKYIYINLYKYIYIIVLINIIYDFLPTKLWYINYNHIFLKTLHFSNFYLFSFPFPLLAFNYFCPQLFSFLFTFYVLCQPPSPCVQPSLQCKQVYVYWLPRICRYEFWV